MPRKILLSAFVCEPGRGSEEGTGWGIAAGLAEKNRVHVISARWNRAVVEKHLGGAARGNLSFSFLDFPPLLLKGVRTSALWQLYYHAWQLRVAKWVEPIAASFDPDLIHHVTYGRYWSPSSLWKLKRPFFWGPVGGGDTTPDAFVPTYSARGKTQEKLRRIARAVSECGPSVRATARHAAFGFPTTPETAVRMEKLGLRAWEVTPHASLGDAEFPARPDFGHAGPPRFCCVGNFLHWKGFHLGIDAFAAAKVPGAELMLIGSGPEQAELEARVARLGISSSVKFMGRLPRAETVALIASCTALVHPSLHDSGGFVCLEAMAYGRPVICLNLGGPGMMVTSETGFSIPATTPAESVAAMAGAIRTLSGNPELSATLGAAGYRRVREQFTWSRKIRQFEDVYDRVLSVR